MPNEDYEPYGPEWAKEMAKWPKALLIEKIKELLIASKLITDYQTKIKQDHD